MSTDLLEQLASYGEQHRAEQSPIALADVAAPAQVPPTVGAPRPDADGRDRFRPRIAVAAAAAVLLVVGGLAWLAGSGDRIGPDDDPTPSTTEPTTSSTTSTTAVPAPETEGLGPVAPVGPGRWTVAATFPEGEIAASDVAELIEEVRSWPGVIDVAEALDAAAWNSLTGLTSECDDDGAPPCGPGIVVFTNSASFEQTALLLERDHGMDVVTPIEVPDAFLEGHVAAAIDTASFAAIDFDTSELGVEQVLVGPLVEFNAADFNCLREDPDLRPQPYTCNVVAVVESEQVRTAIKVEEFGETKEFEVHTGTLGPDGEFVNAEPQGRGVVIEDRLIGRSGIGGTFAELNQRVGTTPVDVLAFLPVEAAVVSFDWADGSSGWQRPIAGMAVIVGDRVGELMVLDANGTEIMRIEDVDGDLPRVQDLRIRNTSDLGTSTPDGESQPVTPTSQAEIVARVGGEPTTVLRNRTGLVAEDDTIWIGTEGEVVRVDVDTGAIERVPVDGHPLKIFLAGEALWTPIFDNTGGDHSVLRIDLATRRITDRFPIPGRPSDSIVADGDLWVISSAGGYTRIDTTTLTAQAVPSGVGVTEQGDVDERWVGVIDGGLWSYSRTSSGPGGATLTRIDLATDAADQFEIEFGGIQDGGIVAGDSIWLVGDLDRVARFDTDAGVITDRLTLTEQHFPFYSAVADDAIWLANAVVGTVTRIDATTAEKTDVITVEAAPINMTVHDGSIWVRHFSEPESGAGFVTRIDIAARAVTDVIEAGPGQLAPIAVNDEIYVVGSDGTVARISVAS